MSTLLTIQPPWSMVTTYRKWPLPVFTCNRSELYLHKNKLNISAVKVSIWIIQHVYYLATLYLFHVRSNSSASYERCVKIPVLPYRISQLNTLWYCISYIRDTSKLLNNTCTYNLSCQNYVYIKQFDIML